MGEEAASPGCATAVVSVDGAVAALRSWFELNEMRAKMDLYGTLPTRDLISSPGDTGVLFASFELSSQKKQQGDALESRE